MATFTGAIEWQCRGQWLKTDVLWYRSHDLLSPPKPRHTTNEVRRDWGSPAVLTVTSPGFCQVNSEVHFLIYRCWVVIVVTRKSLFGDSHVTRTLEEEEEKKMFRPFSKNYEKWLLASSCLSVCLFAWNNSAFTGRISMKFDFFCKIFRGNSNFIKIWQE